jgi:hypothetical protein
LPWYNHQSYRWMQLRHTTHIIQHLAKNIRISIHIKATLLCIIIISVMPFLEIFQWMKM